jgi:hypothetical protein
MSPFTEAQRQAANGGLPHHQDAAASMEMPQPGSADWPQHNGVRLPEWRSHGLLDGCHAYEYCFASQGRLQLTFQMTQQQLCRPNEAGCSTASSAAAMLSNKGICISNQHGIVP